MLERPDIQDERIIQRLRDGYGLPVTQLIFLPLGADINTAVYRVVSLTGETYFLKLRKHVFTEISVAVPQFLSKQGITNIIAPLDTICGPGWTVLDEYTMVLYPFIEGNDGYEIGLSDSQWLDFGAAIGTIHRTQLAPEWASRIPREQFSSRGRETAKRFQMQVKNTSYVDTTAATLAAFMHKKQDEITYIVDRASELAKALQTQPLDYVLCHTDIHPGNILIRTTDVWDDHHFFIVDWDNPIFAPKECDLTLIGGCSSWNNPDQIAQFYRGYFGVQETQQSGINLMALTYYRFERIVQDIAAFCDQILSTDEGREDREQGLAYFTHSFLPGQVVALAFNTDRLFQNDVS